MPMQSGSESREMPWIRWRASVGRAVAGEETWLFRSRLDTFRLLAAVATGGLLLIVLRALLLGKAMAWADLANATCFAFLLAVSFWRPLWLRALTWIGLVSLFINIVDGMAFPAAEPALSVLVLLPMLVLYGTLLGDIGVSLVATAFVLTIYAFTWMRHPPTDREGLMVHMNLCAVAVLIGATSLGAWLRHRRLLDKMDLQAEDLRHELDARLRIHALVVHDIRNPLASLLCAIELGEQRDIRPQAERIRAIVDSVGSLGSGRPILRSEVRVEAIWDYLRDVFSHQLEAKQLRLETAGDAQLVVATDIEILCNSVLSNALNNAMKFSPRGSTIILQSEVVGNRVRLSVDDMGAGFPLELLLRGSDVRQIFSRPGTEGEAGTGYGLRIAALCAERLGGALEIRNRRLGGASTSVLLPTRADG